jgi:hypothetical protein
LRSLRQHTSAPGGASMNLVELFGIVNSRVEMYPSSRESQSEFAVITASTLTKGKSGLLSNSLPGPGACAAHDPAQSSMIGRSLERTGFTHSLGPPRRCNNLDADAALGNCRLRYIAAVVTAENIGPPCPRTERSEPAVIRTATGRWRHPSCCSQGRSDADGRRNHRSVACLSGVPGRAGPCRNRRQHRTRRLP